MRRVNLKNSLDLDFDKLYFYTKVQIAVRSKP